MTVVPTLVVDGYVGTLWKPIIEVHEGPATGPLKDAETMLVKLRDPHDTQTTVTATKIGPGEYQPSIPITSGGPWELIPLSTNPTAPGKLIFNAITP